MEPNGAQWIQIQQLKQELKEIAYGRCQGPFIIEIRCYLSHFLEVNFLDSNLDPDNPNHQQNIVKLIQNLNSEIKVRACHLALQDPTSPIPVKLLQASNAISSGYPMLPVQLYRHICYCLSEEKNLIRQASAANSQSQSRSDDIIAGVRTQCSELNIKISAIARLLKHIQASQENVVIKNNSLKRLERLLLEHLTRCQTQPFPDFDFEKSFRAQKDQLEKETLNQVSTIKAELKFLQEKLGELLLNINDFLKKVIEILKNWKKEQQTKLYHIISIDQIQEWCEVLTDVIVNGGNQLVEFSSLQESFIIPSFAAKIIGENIPIDNSVYKNKMAQLLKELIQNSYIIENQPQQIIKKATKFLTKVRFLIGHKLNLPSGGPVIVDVNILNEIGYRTVVGKNGPGRSKTSGDLINSRQTFELEGGSSRYSADFQNIQVKKIIHKEKKESGDSVLDEPFWLLFQTQFTYNRVSYKVFATSVPIKVTTHVNQESRALQSLIFYDFENDEKSFEKKERPWPELVQSLNAWFTKLTKREPSEDDLKFIENKAKSVPVEGSHTPQSSNSNCISWNRFCKNFLPKTEFSFWSWFYEIGVLTSEHLCGNKHRASGPWPDGLVIGFISRDDAEKCLLNTGRCGTFLLRFSDTVLGAVSICWLHNNKEVMSVVPSNSENLKTHPLPERIMDINNLHYLYPDKPKHQAFHLYLSPQQKEDTEGSNGMQILTKTKYVKALLTTHLMLPEGSLATPGGNPESPDTEFMGIYSNPLMMPTQAFPPQLPEPVPAQVSESVPMECNNGIGPNWIQDFADYIQVLSERIENSPDSGERYIMEDDDYCGVDTSPASSDVYYTNL